MNYLYVILTLLSVFRFSSHGDEGSNQFNDLPLEEKRLLVIDELLGDTIKFSKEGLFHSPSLTIPSTSYSRLYIINRKQFFKFDIVDGTCVLDFINQYLQKSKIKSIEKLDGIESRVLYGTRAENGVTFIQLKLLKRAKTKNCGFVPSTSGGGSNLDQS